MNFTQLDKENNGDYIILLSAVAKLSSLFSDSSIPFIHYRAAENIFCRCFNAVNLSRSDTAFDANLNSLGIGLKTFTCSGKSSMEKVAEFNALSRELSEYKGKKLALQLAEIRNARIDFASRLYNIEKSLYHIVARSEKELVIFESDYNKINLDNVRLVKTSKASIQFEDGYNIYSFNHSKSTLFRKFNIPDNAERFPVEILENPYDLLLELFKSEITTPSTEMLKAGDNYIILPLYGYKSNQKYVFEKSGLNQWNASGRRRDFGEVYIQIPVLIHRLFPGFFPDRNVHFNLIVPTGETFSAKVCQENSKALMTNPNKALSDWLLRRVLQLQDGELATIEKLNELGFDSVMIIKDDNGNYRIDKAKSGSYEEFINITPSS